MSKRRKGYPSETRVKRGLRVVHGGKELTEKLGGDDLCPCDSGKRFKKCCRGRGRFRRREPWLLLLDSDHG
jgi:SEC-C motif